LEAVGPARMVDRKVLLRKNSTASLCDVTIRYSASNLGFALVRWAHPGGLPATSEALADVGQTSGDVARLTTLTH
jgi:hypothetical protein